MVAGVSVPGTGEAALRARHEAVQAWNATLDRLLGGVPRRATRVDPFRLARQAGFVVTRSPRIDGSNLDVACVSGTWHIAVGSFDPPEVQRYLLAREVLALVLTGTPWGEEFAALGASFLLVSPHHFATQCRRRGCDLAALKEQFVYLSYEAIAYRSLVVADGIITVVDGDAVVTRAASAGLVWSAALAPAEEEAMAAARRTLTVARVEREGLVARAWPLSGVGEPQVVARAARAA